MGGLGRRCHDRVAGEDPVHGALQSASVPGLGRRTSHATEAEGQGSGCCAVLKGRESNTTVIRVSTETPFGLLLN